MEFVVNGTKGGFRIILYSTPNAPSIVGDIRNNSSSEDAVGKSLYAIAFAAGGCAYTKFLIIRDTLRSYSTGTIAFSLFLPSNKELVNKGADVKSLLDKVSLYYSDNYIRDNNINRGETTIIQEDWSFVDDILNKYREQDKTTKDEEQQFGTKDAAIIYYKNDVELLEYLDKPFQEEYSNYRQILFIDNNLRGKSTDPINVLRNSGEELINIDLKNETCYLRNYSPSKNVTITVDGEPRSDKKNKNCIKAKWQVEIKYSKDDICFVPIEAKGTLSDQESEIFKFLERKDRNIYIKYEAFNNPNPKTKNISIKVKNQNGDPVTDTIITYKNNNYSPEKTTTSDTITFIGEEIKERWFVSARKDNESLMSESIPIFPENQSEVELILRKQKVIKIFAIDKDSRDPIYNFKLLMNDGQGNRENITELIFRDTDIEKTWRIEISKKIGRDNYSGKREYCPFNGEDPLYIELQKITWQFPQHKTYMINAGMHGKKSHYCPEYSKSSNGNDLAKNCIIPNKGYFFTYWELNDDSKTLIAQYDKKKSFFHNTLLLAFIIAGIIVLVSGIWVFIKILNTNSINAILASHETPKEHPIEQKDKHKSDQKEKLKEPKLTENGQSSRSQQEKNTGSAVQQQLVSNAKISEIIKYINGNELNKDTLYEYKRTKNISITILNSIQLCLDFWDLDGCKDCNPIRTYYSFYDNIIKDKYLNNSCLMAFLIKVHKEVNPGYSAVDKINGLKKR